MNVFDVSLCYNKSNYSYLYLWEAKEMKKFTQWKRRSSHLFGMRPKIKLTTYEGRGGNKVISSALESPFSDAKASENGLLKWSRGDKYVVQGL